MSQLSVDVFGRSMNEAGPRGPPGPKGENGAIVDPTSSYETYVKYINLRRKTIHSIVGFVKMTSNLNIHTDGLLQSLMECNITRHYFYWQTQAFKDKYIAFEFEKPVWLKQIELVLNGHSFWTLHFTWQYSDDGDTWKQIGNEYNENFTTSKDPQFVEPYEIFTFPQEALQERNTKHRYWRMHGLSGQVTSSAYVNVIFINLTL